MLIWSFICILNRCEGSLCLTCLSNGHSNLFILSTLCGEPCDEEGQFSEEKQCANMEAALKKYIERVDGTPCMGTAIKLQRGASGHIFQDRRNHMLIFLQGSAKEKAELKKKDLEEHSYFERMWKVRQNHWDHNLLINYIFLLRCCSKDSCPHPLCKASVSQQEGPIAATQAALKDACK